MRVDGRINPICVHATIDDASRYIVALVAHSPERERDMLDLFANAIRRYGQAACQSQHNSGSTIAETLFVAYPHPMGLPNSFFTLFWALANPHNSGHARARRATEGITLFASVLFNPAEEPALAATLANRLSRLDRSTGDRLLFFVPLQPDEGWEPRLVAERPDVVHFQVGRENVPPVPTSSMETAAWALRLALGLNPNRAVPLIWFCRDPASSVGYFVETSERQLRQQLLALSDLAEELPESRDPETLVQERLSLLPRDPDAAWGRLTVALGNNVAETLASVCAAALTGDSSRYRSSSESLLADLAFRDHEALVSHSTSQSNPATDIDEEQDNENQLLRRFALAAVCALARGQQPAFPSSSYSSWEEASKQFLRIGDGLAPIFKHPNLIAADHSLYAQSWAKAIEVELNASVAHLIRACAGVELPRFFELYDPARGEAPLYSGNQKIDVNAPATNFPRRKGAPWKGIALGTLGVISAKGRRGELLFQPNQSRASEDPISAAFFTCVPDDTDWGDLMRAWQRISELRNVAAHPAPHAFTFSQAEELRKGIETISALPAMRALQKAKGHFKPII